MERIAVLKDKFIHDKMGIPLQTLQNWKKSEGHMQLLYQFLVHQDKENFEKEVDRIADFYGYTLMTPESFSFFVREHWDAFERFRKYRPINIESNIINDEKIVIAAATKKDGSSGILILRYAYSMSKRADSFIKEVDTIIKAAASLGISPEDVQILYITSSVKEPNYFSELRNRVLMVNYSELYQTISEGKIIIV